MKIYKVNEDELGLLREYCNQLLYDSSVIKNVTIHDLNSLKIEDDNLFVGIESKTGNTKVPWDVQEFFINHERNSSYTHLEPPSQWSVNNKSIIFQNWEWSEWLCKEKVFYKRKRALTNNEIKTLDDYFNYLKSKINSPINDLFTIDLKNNLSFYDKNTTLEIKLNVYVTWQEVLNKKPQTISSLGIPHCLEVYDKIKDKGILKAIETLSLKELLPKNIPRIQEATILASENNKFSSSLQVGKIEYEIQTI